MEAALLAALLRRRRAIVTTHLSVAPRLVEAALALGLADEIAFYRNIARRRSSEAMARELRTVGHEWRAPAINLETDARAHAAAAAEAKRWRQRADPPPKPHRGGYRVAATVEPDPVPAPKPVSQATRYRAAIRDQGGGLNRIAITETSEAWSAEREAALAMLPPGIWQEVWDATMDRSTCEACADLDGETTRPGHTFDGYRPPAHPNCRCSTYFEPVRN